jgi:hypothetical protein
MAQNGREVPSLARVVPLASISCWGSLLANPPTHQLRTLVVARYVLYPEAYVWGEGLTSTGQA